MSYCVNCGVELHASAATCPLCNTPVINPRQPHISKHTPYATEKGQVADVDKTDMIILLTTVLASTALICALLNLFVFNQNRWSLAVIGACAILWVMFVPGLINRKISVYFSILLDGIIVVVYLFMLIFMVDRDEWFWGMGLPITVLTTLVIMALVFCYNKLPKGTLARGLYFFSCVAVLVTGLEIIIDLHKEGSIWLTWSLLVGTICMLIDIVIITLLSRRGLREMVRKRLHF
ncbi:MAG: hypothetical protein IKL04_09580 [Lachnospiraceae bacterium]|nr:hypothetical protein [Lachnospiraceae bacterium]